MLEAGTLTAVGELDLHLAGEGRHERIYERLGAHVVDEGVSFAVWAPNARAVSVVGDWNRWDGRANQLELLGSSGIWSAVVPEASEGDGYKFEVHGADGQLRLKADPFAFYAEVPPKTASKIYKSRYEWSDSAWLERRRDAQPLKEPLSIYEVHAESWRLGLGWKELAEQLVSVRRRARLHACRVHAGHAPPVLRVVGVPGDRLLRAGLDDGRARRLPGARRRAARGRDRRDPGLGAGALPARRVRARPLRRHRALRARGPATRLASRLGHARLQPRPERGAELPARERALLGARVPRRRHPRGRRRVDALPRLLAQAGGVGAERVRRPRGPRRRLLPDAS